MRVLGLCQALNI